MGRQVYAAIVDGILGGGVYALMAVGLTLIFGVLDIINIAQGILVVLAAYLSYVLSVHLHLDFGHFFATFDVSWCVQASRNDTIIRRTLY